MTCVKPWGGPVGSISGAGDAPPTGQRGGQGNLGGDATVKIDLQEVLVETLEGAATFGGGRQELEVRSDYTAGFKTKAARARISSVSAAAPATVHEAPCGRPEGLTRDQQPAG